MAPITFAANPLKAKLANARGPATLSTEEAADLDAAVIAHGGPAAFAAVIASTLADRYGPAAFADPASKPPDGPAGPGFAGGGALTAEHRLRFRAMQPECHARLIQEGVKPSEIRKLQDEFKRGL